MHLYIKDGDDWRPLTPGDLGGGGGGGSGGDASAANQLTQTARLESILAKLIASPATAANQALGLDGLAAISGYLDGVEGALGAQADTAVDQTAAGSILARLRFLSNVIGNTTAGAATAGGEGSVNGKLRLLTSMLPATLGAKAGNASLSVVPATDAVHSVGGFAANPSASFARPADTTAYAAGDLIANSTSAGSVAPLQVTVARVAAGSFMLRRLKLAKSGTSVTNAAFRVHFWTTAPTVANGDNGALSASGVASYVGAFDVTMDRSFSDGACSFGVPVVGSDITVKLASGTSIYALVEARGAYTPASGETFTVTLDDLQN